MPVQERLELLSPARNLEAGIAAIDHGADAVYIGGPAFGARAAAGNSLTDIEKLAVHAHRYHARVLLALNTLLHPTSWKPPGRSPGRLMKREPTP